MSELSLDADAAPDTDEPSATVPLAVRYVRALLERHGLPKYRQSAWLADATGLSYSQAHRRLNGASPWSLEDLERVAAMFGESLADLVSAPQRSSVAGVMKLGPANLPCQLWLGSTAENPRPNDLVAIRTATGWTALTASEAAEHVAYRVERLEATPSAPSRRVIAVLDDDQDLAGSICSHLGDSGYDPRAFYRTADLEAAAQTTSFEGFVIDWLVGESSALDLIATLRAQHPSAPIVVLTAQVLTGMVQESEIADAVAAYNLVFAEKPVRMAILSASLARAFATS
ncbi:helix-turn-helix domain-containing protein [Piscinibacter koreensis]|uniref:Response regulatory domain-containing protein n=1 Tax=Piscinibacter koreensis TaxID=2742824 RepID=A0A7Y6NMB5_9BURK|nr:helix-turn-helix domain-containing protein [Schlegelella koreensis]NUZ05754.1 hypothetical protein [Schlegelella koreensis]